MDSLTVDVKIEGSDRKKTLNILKSYICPMNHHTSLYLHLSLGFINFQTTKALRSQSSVPSVCHPTTKHYSEYYTKWTNLIHLHNNNKTIRNFSVFVSPHFMNRRYCTYLNPLSLQTSARDSMRNGSESHQSIHDNFYVFTSFVCFSCLYRIY